MSVQEMLEKVLKSYEVYYDVNRQPEPPFAAEAVFRSHNEQFFLTRSAKISEAESVEYVFFAAPEHLDVQTLQQLDQRAWSEGLSRVRPHGSHRNTDVTLVIVAGEMDGDAAAAVKKLRRYKSYRLGFQGWSNYRVIALEASSGHLAFNRQGQSLKKLFRNIVSNS